SEISDRQTREGLKSMYLAGRTYAASFEAESQLSGRISQVMGRHSFGDLAQAVTNFYRNKPLQKDKPVIWVLAVPLYKEFQEGQAKEKRLNVYDSVSFEMEREVSK